MHNIIESIRQNLAQAHRRAIDCDAYLDALQEQGYGQFSHIFNDAFETRSDRFLPYVEEVAKDFYQLTQLTKVQLDQVENETLSRIVSRLELIFTTQAQFLKTFADDED